MKQSEHRSKLLMVFIMIILILTKSTISWKDDLTTIDTDKVPDFLTLLDEQQKICNNIEDVKDCQYLMSENIKDYSIKRKLIEASTLPLKYVMNSAHDADGKSHCSCGMDNRLADLGYSYFPRYIATGICRKDGCRSKYSKCSPKTYKVHVLRRKDVDEPEIEQKNSYVSLPDSLKNSWVVETVKVNVACHCTYT